MQSPAAVLLAFFLIVPLAQAKIVTQPIDYTDEKGAPLEGFVIYDDAVSAKHPGIPKTNRHL
ncbi:MAG TPA: hypothetical protein VL981_00880 [Candidatus Methylacidiphilales bacterium]|nr:hypothetical protein [Candidatus Methylacidiphilales bacterium]